MKIFLTMIGAELISLVLLFIYAQRGAAYESNVGALRGMVFFLFLIVSVIADVAYLAIRFFLNFVSLHR